MQEDAMFVAHVGLLIGSAWLGFMLCGCADSGAHKPPQEGGPGQAYHLGAPAQRKDWRTPQRGVDNGP